MVRLPSGKKIGICEIFEKPIKKCRIKNMIRYDDWRKQLLEVKTGDEYYSGVSEIGGCS